MQNHTGTHVYKSEWLHSVQWLREKIRFMPSSLPESFPHLSTTATGSTQKRHKTSDLLYIQISLYEFHFKMIYPLFKWYSFYRYKMTAGIKTELIMEHGCKNKRFSALNLYDIRNQLLRREKMIHSILEWNPSNVKALHWGRMDLWRSYKMKHTNSAAMRTGRCIGWGYDG